MIEIVLAFPVLVVAVMSGTRFWRARRSGSGKRVELAIVVERALVPARSRFTRHDVPAFPQGAHAPKPQVSHEAPVLVPAGPVQASPVSRVLPGPARQTGLVSPGVPEPEPERTGVVPVPTGSFGTALATDDGRITMRDPDEDIDFEWRADPAHVKSPPRPAETINVPTSDGKITLGIDPDDDSPILWHGTSE